MASIVIETSFLRSAAELPKEIAKKVLKAFSRFVSDKKSVGLHLERLSSGLWSMRADDNYRIIYSHEPNQTAVALFVGAHDDAYRFAKSRVQSASAAKVSGSIGAIERRKITSPEESPTVVELHLEPFERLLLTKKYLPLSQYLAELPDREVRVTFSEIEKIIGGSLPPAAAKHSAWWGNDSTAKSGQRNAWMAIGWRTKKVDFAERRVTFFESPVGSEAEFLRQVRTARHVMRRDAEILQELARK